MTLTAHPPLTTAPALTWEVKDGVAVVILDLQGHPVNVISRAVKDEFLACFAALADDPAFVGYPYPLARAHHAARVTGYDVVDVRRSFREALSRRGMAEDDVELLFQDFHEVLNR